MSAAQLNEVRWNHPKMVPILLTKYAVTRKGCALSRKPFVQLLTVHHLAPPLHLTQTRISSVIPTIHFSRRTRTVVHRVVSHFINLITRTVCHTPVKSPPVTDPAKTPSWRRARASRRSPSRRRATTTTYRRSTAASPASPSPTATRTRAVSAPTERGCSGGREGVFTPPTTDRRTRGSGRTTG